MMEGRIQVAAYEVWVYLTVAVCTHPSLYTTQCMHAYGEAHTEGGCAYTNIDDASQDTGKGVRVQLSTHLRARVVYTVDTLPPFRDGAREGRDALQIHEVRAGERRQALEELDGLGVAQVRVPEPVL
jgi:hypothetical protein